MRLSLATLLLALHIISVSADHGSWRLSNARRSIARRSFWGRGDVEDASSNNSTNPAKVVTVPDSAPTGPTPTDDSSSSTKTSTSSSSSSTDSSSTKSDDTSTSDSSQSSDTSSSTDSSSASSSTTTSASDSASDSSPTPPPTPSPSPSSVESTSTDSTSDSSPSPSPTPPPQDPLSSVLSSVASDLSSIISDGASDISSVLDPTPPPDSSSAPPDPTPSDSDSSSPSPSDSITPSPSPSDPISISVSVSVPDPSSSAPPDPSSSAPPDPPSSSSAPPDPTPSSDPPVSVSTSDSASPSSAPSDSSTSVFSAPSDILPSVTDSVPDAVTTITESSISLSVPSDFSGWLTQTSSLLIASVPTTSATVINTDPDAATSTQSAAMVTPTIPSDLPESIYPATQLDLEDPDTQKELEDYTLISILFGPQLGWVFVVQNPQSTGQLFAFTPQLIAGALNISPDQVKTYKLGVFISADYNGDPSTLRTTFQAFIPKDQVDDLQSQISARNSGFYARSSGAAKQIADLVDPTYKITSNAPNGPGVGSAPGATPSSDLSKSSNTRRNAIIGVCATIGGIILLILLWFGADKAKRRREQAHQRLYYNGNEGRYSDYGAVGANGGGGGGRVQSPVYAQNPFQHEDDMAERRRSFFFAEDSLRGYVQEREEETTYMHRSPSGSRRGPIHTQAISNPILRESSLNW